MSRHPDMRLVVLGFGYSAKALMRSVRPGSVIGTTRSPERAEDLHRWGVRSIVTDGSPSPTLSEAIRSATHILVSAAPGEQGDPFRYTYERDLAHAACGLPSQPLAAEGSFVPHLSEPWYCCAEPTAGQLAAV